jgi:hypothetical protein
VSIRSRDACSRARSKKKKLYEYVQCSKSAYYYAR